MNFWVNTVSKDHIARGIAGGFTQANHGKDTVLKRLKAGDYIVFYSPKTAYEGGEPLQAFTAVARVKGEDLYQVEMFPGFKPWRRNVTFFDCTETSIRPLIEDLTFIKDKSHWGYAFRYGMFKIPHEDFELIRQTMQVKE